MADTSENIILKSLLTGNNNLPFSTLSGLAGAQTKDDQTAQSLSDIAGGIQPGGIFTALLKGVTQGVAMTKKDKAQEQRDAMNAHLQQLAEWEVKNKQHQAEVEDFAQAHVYSQAKQGAFVDGLNAVVQGGDPQPVVDS